MVSGSAVYAYMSTSIFGVHVHGSSGTQRRLCRCSHTHCGSSRLLLITELVKTAPMNSGTNSETQLVEILLADLMRSTDTTTVAERECMAHLRKGQCHTRCRVSNCHQNFFGEGCDVCRGFSREHHLLAIQLNL